MTNKKLKYISKDEAKKYIKRKKEKNTRKYNDNSILKIWNGHGFMMSGLGEKNKIIGKLKHIKRCCKYTYQRAYRGFSDMDAWNMYSYLEELIPAMLQYLRNNRMGSPVFDVEEDYCTEKWNKILDRMIFLWKEANESTCSRKNIYEEEYIKSNREFDEKYGMFGKKLLTEEEKKNSAEGKGTRIYTTLDVPEYKEITEKYLEYEKKIDRYRDHCKNEALNLLKKYFYGLWD